MQQQVVIDNFKHLQDASNLSQQYEALLETGFCYINYATQKAYISDTVFALLKIPKRSKRLSFKEIIRFVKKSERHRFMEQFFSRMPFDDRIEGIFTVISDPAQEHRVQLFAHTYFDKQKRPTSTIATITDITAEESSLNSLNVTNEQLRNIFEVAGVGILILDTETLQFVTANPTISKMIGYTSEEFTHLKITDIHPKDALAQVKSSMEAQLSGTASTASNIPVLRKDGTLFHCDITAKRLTVDSKTYLVGIFHDLTQSQRLEELEISDVQLRHIFEQTDVGIIIAEGETSKYVMTNPAIAKMLGYSEEEMGQLSFKDLHPKKDLSYLKREFFKMARGEVQGIFDLPMVRKDGSIFYANLSAKRIILDDKVRLVGFFTDITQQKEMQKRLQEGETQNSALNSTIEMQNLVTSITTDFLFLLDAQGQILWKNEAFEQAFSKIIHKTHFDHSYIADSQKGSIQKLIHSALNHGFSEGNLLLKTDYKEEYYHFKLKKTTIKNIDYLAVSGHSIHAYITQKKLAKEKEKFAKDLDSISNILASKITLDEKINRILFVMLSIFDVERAWLYRQIPSEDSATPMVYQQTKKGFDIDHFDFYEHATDPINIELFEYVKSQGKVLQIDRSFIQGEIPQWVEDLEIYNSMVVALEPKQDDIWMLGMHQCHQESAFTSTQERFFTIVAQRVESVFGQFLLTQDLQKDIEERKKVEAELKESQENLKLAATVFSNTDEGVIITDTNSNIQEVNKAFTTITGYERSEAVGKDLSIISSHLHSTGFWKHFWTSIKEKGNFTGEVKNKRKNGEVYTQWLTVSTVINDDNELTGYVGVFSDITEMKNTQERLRHYAHHDPLTNLPNRLLFSNRITHAIQRATRNKQHFAVIFLDLDHFKDINDTLGHHIGDSLLKEVAKRIKMSIRIDDTLARIGGDEFLILLENIQKDNDVIKVVEKIKKSLQPKFELENQIIHITASMGVALYPTDGQDVDTLLKNSDAAMYSSKEQGRNRYSFYTAALTVDAMRRVQIENAMREALENDLFELFYQPQIDQSTRKVSGLEALIRWEHPTLGTLPPDKFIPLAEESGLIIELGRWVMNAATKQARIWLDQKIDFKKISINVSGQQVWNTPLFEELEMYLHKYKLSGHCIEVEVTESFIMREMEKGIEELKAIKDLGVSIAIDDFGTGYSSLNYLKELPLSKLKIDKSFIDHVPEKKESVAITKTIISLANNLGLEIIAEGVETKAQLDFLAQEGCNLIQGYYFSKPLNVKDATIFLKKNMAL